MGKAVLPKVNKLSKKKVYTGKIIDLYEEEILIEDQKVNWILADHKGVSAIIALDSDDSIIMVKQYRNTLDDYSLEIPAGGLDRNEDPLEGAKRELLEETGYTAKTWIKLYDYLSSIGFSNEKINLYLAKDLELTKEVNLDKDEFVVVEKWKIEDLLEMIKNNNLKDGKTIMAVLTINSYLK